ncbi:HD-GYP domain-containing protein [Bacillus sp. 1NLA3E]|uniref:HD-GYP domain-containing protein n=1 Tax=Bacillus sp. 1NLA3E TaxID=666686 RepID=UPI000247E933|nr:HD-GYP domain-containing protein [Bacillus sp. 1NLA3E]AGK52189.1 metal dependent phosphohydrolase [Bacillus sp. 1NLA3E]
MTLKAKLYIFAHIILTILIFTNVMFRDFSFSFIKILPLFVFGCFLEGKSLIAFSIKGQEVNISAGSAVILAGIILFNPLEIIVFSFFYGLVIIIFPLVKDLYKFVFNISQTVNITYLSYLVWANLHVENTNLLNPENIGPLLLTMFTFVFLDLITIGAVISFATGEKFRNVLKGSLDWVIVSYGLVAFIGLLLAVVYDLFYIYGLIGFVLPLFLMRYNMYLFSKEKEKQVDQLKGFNDLLKENNEQLLLTLSQVIDARDNSLFGHSASVSKYALEIGKRLGVPEEDLHDLKRGALIHDIGKLAISEKILQKPGPLSDMEFKIIKTHTLIGERIMKQTKGMEKVAVIIGQHHEHYNGEGYPRKLKGEEILLESRIVTLCDSVDTMLSTRSYKKGWSLEEVMKEVQKCSGTHFDPQVAEAFIEIANEKGAGFFKNSAEFDHDRVLKNLLIRHAKEVD